MGPILETGLGNQPAITVLPYVKSLMKKGGSSYSPPQRTKLKYGLHVTFWLEGIFLGIILDTFAG